MAPQSPDEILEPIEPDDVKHGKDVIFIRQLLEKILVIILFRRRRLVGLTVFFQALELALFHPVILECVVKVLIIVVILGSERRKLGTLFLLLGTSIVIGAAGGDHSRSWLFVLLPSRSIFLLLLLFLLGLLRDTFERRSGLLLAALPFGGVFSRTEGGVRNIRKVVLRGRL